MKRVIFGVVAVLSVESGFAALFVDFNSPGALAGNFSSAQAGPIVQSANGGLANSGALDLSGMTGGTSQQILTLNQSFAGNLSSWTASIFYRGNAQNFWQFGITTEAAPAINDTWAYNGAYLPVIFFQSGDLDDGAIGFTNYSPAAGPTAENGEVVLVPGNLPTSAAWYQYVISVNYLGASQYSVQGTLTQANADGSLGAQLATVTSTFTNSELAGDSSVYLYLNMYDGVAIDNFSTTAVPEVSSLALAGMGMLAAGFRRRRGGA